MITDREACYDKNLFIFGQFIIDSFKSKRFIFMVHYDLVHVRERRFHYDEAIFGF